MSGRPRLVRARALLVGPERLLEDGAVLLEGPRIARVGAWSELADAVAPEDREDLGAVLLTPGLVNAHAHLELTALAGCAPSGVSFDAWIEALLGARAAIDEQQLWAGRAAGAAECLATGTTTVGDIDSLGLGPLVGPAPRRVVYRELLDARDPGRTPETVAHFEAPRDLGPLDLDGVSPHAPFSVSEALLAAIAPNVRARDLPLAVHWAETADEVAWLDGAAAWFDRFFPRAGARHGLDALDAAGLLGPRTALVHGNHPRPGEPERIAAAGATVVHCPGSHAWFGREPFPFEAYRRAGVGLALGTDSRVSNEALDLRRELALASVAAPDADPQSLWSAATEGGARALGLGARIGRLEPGREADLVAFDLRPDGRRAALEGLVAGRPAVVGLWVAGRAIARDGGPRPVHSADRASTPDDAGRRPAPDGSSSDGPPPDGDRSDGSAPRTQS